MNWTYAESDAALMLFTAALDRFIMTFPSTSRVLELGCAETDWLERMRQADPTLDLVGVDAREQQPRDHSTVGDACNPDLFPTESFDRIVLLGALEHFGLGFYGDPKYLDGDDCHGDILAMQNVTRWLKPGGCVYFDVPCNPVGCITPNRHYRVYSPAEVSERLLPEGLTEIQRGYSKPEPHAGTWVDEPTVSLVPYWYVAVWAQKVTP